MDKINDPKVLCINCAHFVNNSAGHYSDHKCYRSGRIYTCPVDGNQRVVDMKYCSVERIGNKPEECGEEGKYFVAKPQSKEAPKVSLMHKLKQSLGLA